MERISNLTGENDFETGKVFSQYIKNHTVFNITDTIADVKMLVMLFNKHSVTHWLSFGTLLGCIRNNGFISSDTDVDIGCLRSQSLQIANAIIEAKTNGFNVLRCYHDNGLVTIGKNGAYIDLYLFVDRGGIWECNGWLLKPRHQQLITHKFYDIEVNIPSEFDQLLVSWYGPTWRIPQSGKQAIPNIEYTINHIDGNKQLKFETDDVWEFRSKTYEHLQWVTDEKQFKVLCDILDPRKTDNVLDFGCGTGVISNNLAPMVSHITAIDTSSSMLDKFIIQHDNITKYQLGSELTNIVPTYNKIIARMVFHHIKNQYTTLKNCYDLLLPNGLFLLQENGIFNDGIVNKWFHDLMLQKEERYFLSEELLCYTFKSVGFTDITVMRYKNKDFSIRNWLENTTHSEEEFKYFFDLHLNAPQNIKTAYNLRVVENDILLDTECLFVVGRKVV